MVYIPPLAPYTLSSFPKHGYNLAHLKVPSTIYKCREKVQFCKRPRKLQCRTFKWIYLKTRYCTCPLTTCKHVVQFAVFTKSQVVVALWCIAMVCTMCSGGKKSLKCENELIFAHSFPHLLPPPHDQWLDGTNPP